MKKITLSALILLFTLISFSQENSLLWEISGNGLTKNSYLYGTMHVSKKVAFRLDDVFYEALNKSECVALESDPTKWLEYSHEDLNFRYNNLNGNWKDNFYSKLFKLEPLHELAVRSIIRFDNNLINGYLYRKNSLSDNFEEETYLDMFIFQAGKKNGKPIVGLEDIGESRFLTSKASYNISKSKPDAWLTKMMKDENPYLLQENVYRERNISLLDSIGAATNTNFYREHMLFIRNENMVDVLDSIMPLKSTFAGVGAAHLAGEKGMIQMLKDKVYTVKALTSKQTKFAKNEKEKLENLFIEPVLNYHATPDGFLKIKSFDTLREFTFNKLKYYIATDMTNGAYLTINRLNTFDYLPSKKDKISLDDIKNMLYEDIPGDILEQEEFTTPYPGISILNKTKKGDYQKYHIYKTPLEIIVIKFGGKQDFALKYHKDIFDSIEFKKRSLEMINFKGLLDKYSFQFPKYHSTDNLEKPGKKMIQGVVDTDYYFFQESPYYDLSYIEEDDFEAKYIHTDFYRAMGIDELEGEFKTTNYSSYESSAEIDSTTHKKLWLKSIVKDGSYYLLGYTGNDKSKASSFFNSFRVKNPTYEIPQKVIDTSLLFTVNTTTKAPSGLNRFNFSYRDSKKPYEEFTKNTSYTSKSNERISISKTKFHDLQMYENADSLWGSLNKKRVRTNTSRKRKLLNITDESKYVENGNNIYTYKLKDSLSKKEILVKYIQQQGVLFKLSTLTDNGNETSQFISEFYDSFKPIDSVLGEDVFNDKTSLFFDALKDNDSIVLNGYSKLIFKKDHINELINTIENVKFSEDKEKIKTHLIYQLIKLDDDKVANNYIKNLYINSYTKPSIQNTILNALLIKNNKASNKMVLELMKIDVPLNNRYSKFSFYNSKSDLSKISEQLFPDLLEFTSIEEYKNPVYSLLTRLLDSNEIKPKSYKSIKKQLINNAKTEIKRSLIKRGNSNSKSLMLENYTKLLFPFRKDNSVSDFYLKLIESKNTNALTTLYALLRNENEPISEALKKETLFNKNAQATLIEKLQEKELLTDDILEIIDLETYAKSKLINGIRNIKDTDSIKLLEKRIIKTDKEKPIEVFVYERQTKQGGREYSFLYFIAFEKSNSKIYNTEPYFKSKNYGIRLDQIDSKEEIIDQQLILIKHKTRKRVSLNKSGSFF